VSSFTSGWQSLQHVLYIIMLSNDSWHYCGGKISIIPVRALSADITESFSLTDMHHSGSEYISRRTDNVAWGSCGDLDGERETERDSEWLLAMTSQPTWPASGQHFGCFKRDDWTTGSFPVVDALRMPDVTTWSRHPQPSLSTP